MRFKLKTQTEQLKPKLHLTYPNPASGPLIFWSQLCAIKIIRPFSPSETRFGGSLNNATFQVFYSMARAFFEWDRVPPRPICAAAGLRGEKIQLEILRIKTTPKSF